MLFALEAARAGTFRVDLRTGALRASAALAALHGMPADAMPDRLEELLALVHADDRPTLAAAVRRTAEEGLPYSLDVRAVWPDGSVRWLHAAGRRVEDGDGRPAALVGIARDTSGEHATRRAGDEVRALLDAVFATAPIGLAFLDTDLRYVRVNAAMAAAVGLSVEDHLGRTAAEVLPSPLREIVARRAAEVQRTGRVITDDDRASDVGLAGGGERHYTVSYYPVLGADGGLAGVGIVLSDATARAQAAAARERALERTRFLAELSGALDASLDYDGTLSAVADLVVGRLADWCSIDIVDAEDRLRNVAVAHVDPAKATLARELQERHPPDPDASAGAANVALRTGEPELYPQITDELLERSAERSGAGARRLELIRAVGATSAMVVPLRARDRVIGALTLVATDAGRAYGSDDLAFAQEIAARAALAVDNARLYREAREQERRSEEARAILDTLIDRAPIGVAFLDREGRYVRINDALAEMHGLPAADHLGHPVATILPGLAEQILDRIERVLASGTAQPDIEVSGPVPGDPASTRHFLAGYYPVPLPDGQTLGVGATVLDLTSRVRAREELRRQRDQYEALLRAQSELGEAVALLERERIVFANDAAERLTGRSAEELYALDSLLDIVPAEQRRALRARLREPRPAVARSEPGIVTEIVRPDGTRVPVEAASGPVPGGDGERVVVIARDITERREQDAERERLLRREQAARRASEAAHARVRLLADVSALLERSLSHEESLPDVAELLVARLSDSAMVDVLGRDGRLRRPAAASRTPGGAPLLRSLADADRLDPRGEHPIARTLRGRQAVFLDDPAERYMRDVAPTPDAVARFRTAVGRSLAVVPLVARGRSVGVLTVGWQQAGRRPTRDEWSLIQAIAQRIALAVDSALQYEERAYVARTLQQSLLPVGLPTIPGAEVAAEYVAAGGVMDVGGDFFDVFDLGGADDWALLIGDVCGKGAEAAAVTALARYTLRAVTTKARSPADTLATLNDAILRQLPDPRFLTAVLGHVAIAADGGARVTCSSGGHPPPVVLRAGGRPEVPACRGMLLGVLHEAHSADCVFDLRRGDALVLYTDGITEARPDRPLWAAELGEGLQPALADGAAAIAARAVAIAEERAGGTLRDDVAVLVLRLTEG